MELRLETTNLLQEVVDKQNSKRVMEEEGLTPFEPAKVSISYLKPSEGEEAESVEVKKTFIVNEDRSLEGDELEELDETYLQTALKEFLAE